MGAPAPEADPTATSWTELQAVETIVFLPFVETLIGQWLPIQLLRRFFKSPWWLAGLVSAIWFTVLHGYTDRMVINMLVGAVVLSAIFIIEVQRNGWPIFSTYLAHALANAMVVVLHRF